ncbi:hypothetical protein [Commensalibacter nepenthis]|uniref:Uncharacterized protein n=1 Tax=Commensalibacter nepenthis TaxID=3043872 RepID=A0ABT6QB02_9PROT|nr:hypothetical protein [Commensalibacter sp. TBRC 10068]MDI2113932.1 hypothetical protein [Commensalibacter sp. TBRC 10068]
MIDGLTKPKSLQVLIANDIQTSNTSIEHACEVMDCLIDTLERGMKEHQHFEGYIEEYINRARWVISKIFDDANSIQQAVKESEAV